MLFRSAEETFQLCFKVLSVDQLRNVEQALKKKNINIPSDDIWRTHCEKEYGERKKIKNSKSWEETYRLLELAQQEKHAKSGGKARNITKQAELIKQKSGVKTLSPQTARATTTIAKSRTSYRSGSTRISTSSHHRENNIYDPEARKKLFSKIGSKR